MERWRSQFINLVLWRDRRRCQFDCVCHCRCCYSIAKQKHFRFVHSFIRSRLIFSMRALPSIGRWQWKRNNRIKYACAKEKGNEIKMKTNLIIILYFPRCFCFKCKAKIHKTMFLSKWSYETHKHTHRRYVSYTMALDVCQFNFIANFSNFFLAFNLNKKLVSYTLSRDRTNNSTIEGSTSLRTNEICRLSLKRMAKTVQMSPKIN